MKTISRRSIETLYNAEKKYWEEGAGSKKNLAEIKSACINISNECFDNGIYWIKFSELSGMIFGGFSISDEKSVDVYCDVLKAMGIYVEGGLKMNEELKKIRWSTGLTQKEFAEKIGIGEGTYIAAEHGKASKKTAYLIDKAIKENGLCTDARIVER